MLYAEKDFNLPQHPEVESVSNLIVIKLMQSFKSRELVTERFAWRHYYWCAPVSLLPQSRCALLRGFFSPLSEDSSCKLGCSAGPSAMRTTNYEEGASWQQ